MQHAAGDGWTSNGVTRLAALAEGRPAPLRHTLVGLLLATTARPVIRLGADLPLTECKKLVDKADVTGDGLINFKEFEQVCKELAK